MADKKISQLDRLDKIDGKEQIPVAKDGENYSITPAQITADVVAELEKKADKSEVTKSLQEKLDRTEFTERMQTVTEQLAEKADATSVEDILKLIPTQASESNKLADKDFVNSSIATNTAEFKGTFSSLGELQKQTADANDYGYVVSTDLEGNTVYNKYKYVEGEGWKFEYALNNSSFTAAQFAAINSGATKELIEKLLALPNASDILTGKQAAAKYFPLTDGQDLEHLVETLNEGLGQVEEDMKLLATKSELEGKLGVNDAAAAAQKIICTPNTTTDISKVPTTSQLAVVNTSQSGTFRLASAMTAGTELQVFINNTGSDIITITIPDTFKHNGTTSIYIPAGNYGEINVISDGTILYLRAV